MILYVLEQNGNNIGEFTSLMPLNFVIGGFIIFNEDRRGLCYLITGIEYYVFRDEENKNPTIFIQVKEALQ